MKNITFIDGQNLHLGIKEEGWNIDLKKLRIYLKDKYSVVEAIILLDILKMIIKIYMTIFKKLALY